ncbi:MAG: hypothetical protein LUD16_04025 [Lachnospiraceae bacterium]|nr:hypothetical protein [Lachnospiraceae bacterium]
MNNENLSSVFEQYINRFDDLNALDSHDEGYKWRVESHFVKYWDIDADDFASMFKTAMEEVGKTNLIDNKSVHPIGGIRMLLKQDSEVEFVRQCFRELFSDDGGDLVARQGRILSFMDKINSRIKNYESGSWKYPQKINDVIYYLNLWRPWENYIFKSTEATNWANCIEFGDDFGSGADFSLEKYYHMCDELLDAVQSNEAIMKLHAERFAREAQGYDGKLHISFPSGDKLFQYPAGIEKGFLSVPDESLMEKIVFEIRTKAELDVAEKKAVDAKKEYERLQREMELI